MDTELLCGGLVTENTYLYDILLLLKSCSISAEEKKVSDE